MFNQILNNAMKFNVSTVSVEFTSNTIWTAPSTGNVVFECWGGGGDGGGNGAGLYLTLTTIPDQPPPPDDIETLLNAVEGFQDGQGIINYYNLTF